MSANNTMPSFSAILISVGCILISSQPGAATSPSLRQVAAFTSGSRHQLQVRRSHELKSSCLQAQSTKHKNPLLELVSGIAFGKRTDSGDIESVQDFDTDLANEIQDALLSAGVDVDSNDSNDKDFLGSGDFESVQDFDAEPANGIQDAPLSAGVDMDSNDSNGKDLVAEGRNGSTNPIIKPPVENKTSKYAPELPPHTALAQVLANQYGVDLADVAPSKGPGSKITAEDVEYHAWRVVQPPSTADALELAYTLGLDLNVLYDDEDGEMVLELSDVQLYQQNLGSLKMTSQAKKGVQFDNNTKKTKKLSALDKRMESNMDKLSEKARKLAGTVTGGIVQQVQQQVQQVVALDVNEKLREGGDDIKTVEDFDADLASEIQAALSSADFNAYDKSEDVSEILPAVSSADPNSDGNSEANSNLAEQLPAGLSKKGLQSMTCLQLKEELRLQGMKVSGKKAELVDRLLNGANVETPGEGVSDDIKSDSTPFFASLL